MRRRTASPVLVFAALMLAWTPAAAQIGFGQDLARAVGERAAAEDAARLAQEQAVAARARARKLRDELEALTAEAARLDARRAEAARTVTEDRAETDRLRRDVAAAQARLIEERRRLHRLLARLQSAAREPSAALLSQPGRPLDAARGALALASMTSVARRDHDRAEARARRSVEALNREAPPDPAAEGELARLSREQAEARARLEAGRAALLEADAEADRITSQAGALARHAAELSDRAEAMIQQARALHTPPPSMRGLSFSQARGHLIPPVDGPAIRPFGVVRPGLNFETEPYARVVAPWDGLVVFADRIKSDDRIVIIEPQKGYQILLTGLSTLDVRAGDRVTAGQPVGGMGGSGIETGGVGRSLSPNMPAQRERLHFEILEQREPIDPVPWLRGSTER